MNIADKTVAVFSLGGTIAMTADRNSGGVVPALSAKDLLAAVPELDAAGVTLKVHDFRRIPGASLTIEDVAELSSAIADELGRGAHGAVVTQGTDTIEETAFLLDLMHSCDGAVVVTGAMRNPTLPGADGPANLYAAVLTAADPSTRGMGCLVTLNDEIHPARSVRKTHTVSTAAFASPGSGPLGRVVEGRVVLSTRPLPRRFPSLDAGHGLPVRVGLHTVTLGDEGGILAAMGKQCDGLVVAAFGVGHVPHSMVAPLEELASRMPVVLASRIGTGPVLTQTYGFAGSETDLRSRGLIGAGDLDPYKARLLLHLLLAGGRSREDISAVFSSME